MPAHTIWKEDNGKNGYYVADGYRVRSLKTKSKAHVLPLLKQYNYTEWIGRQVPPLVRPG
jgi:hypothetical protein